MGVALRALAIWGLVACGGTHGDDDGEGATLVLEPPTSEHLILNGVPATQAFSAFLVAPDGDRRDVTSETAFSIDSAFGGFAGNTLSIGVAGKTVAYGVYQDKSGSAQVLARLKTTRVDPSLPSNVPDIFTRPEDATRAPRIVYPPEGVVMPRNLGDFETHWTDANGNNVFEVSLRTEFADVRVYVPGNNGVPAAGPRPSWSAFTATEWTQSVGIETEVQYQVRGANTGNPTYVGSAPLRIVRLSNEPMQGGLYYWAAASASGDPEGIWRHDMSKPGQPAEEFITKRQTSNRCVACHALSRDGKQMAITYDGGGNPANSDGSATTVDVGTGTRRTSVARWNFATYTPDGQRLITVFAGDIVVRDPTSMTVLATMPDNGGYVSHPDVAGPDGTRLVYTRSPGGTNDWDFTGGTIYTRTFDPVANTFGAEVPLVTAGTNNFYPSWSPDGKWIMFNRSNGGTSYNNLDASLWVVSADGGTPIQLVAMNQAAGGLTNSWGRWAPFLQTVGANRDPIFWITVSSKRDFGVRRINSVEPEDRLKTPQIWMAPFFAGQAARGVDPSSVAFRLPFQNLTSNNHIAQWTERVVITQ